MLRTAWSVPINPKSPAARLNRMICFIPVIPTFGLDWGYTDQERELNRDHEKYLDEKDGSSRPGHQTRWDVQEGP